LVPRRTALAVPVPVATFATLLPYMPIFPSPDPGLGLPGMIVL
jgi:hypothetical protein